jgi:hypothetical protein
LSVAQVDHLERGGALRVGPAADDHRLHERISRLQQQDSHALDAVDCRFGRRILCAYVGPGRLDGRDMVWKV